MRHFHLDEFAKGKSFIHSLDPRAKILSTIGFIFMAAGVTTPELLFAAAFLWLLLLVVSGVPVFYILNRLAWVIPFAGVMIVVFPFIKEGEAIWLFNVGFTTLTATREGLQQAVILMGRVLTSISAILFLTLSTRFHYMLKGLALLRVPTVLLQLLEFTVRYIFVTLDELKRMRRARNARAFVAGRTMWHLHTLRTLGQLVGALFIRSYERGERVYLAMLSRGYTGQMKTLHDFRLKMKDILWASLVIGVGLILMFVDRKGF